MIDALVVEVRAVQVDPVLAHQSFTIAVVEFRTHIDLEVLRRSLRCFDRRSIAAVTSLPVFDLSGSAHAIFEHTSMTVSRYLYPLLTEA